MPTTNATNFSAGAAVTVCPCPGCGHIATGEPREIFHGASLSACEQCYLHFWHPAVMPNGKWYEAAYQGRDRSPMPLEPGHRFFLSDPKAPKSGRLLDLGCGVGNFVSAARDAGFDAAGVEFDASAVRFAQQHYGLKKVFAMVPEEFRATYPRERFDVVTFFEVLEHQDDPRRFLNLAKEFLTEGGYIAVSVPNRGRWQKGTETLDYPPNHLTRWSPRALKNFLEHNGFVVLSIRQESLGVRRAAQVLSAGLPTGLVARIAGSSPPTLADLAEMPAEEMKTTVDRLEHHRGHRLAARLARYKTVAMIPISTLLMPYLRLRGYTGLYLYCLARKK